MTIAEKIAAMQQGAKAPVKPLVLSSGQAPEMKNPEPAQEERSLGEVHGQGVDQTPLDAPQEVKAWHNALSSFASELCMTNDPQNPEMAWLAIRSKDKPLQPILLHQFPFWEHPQTVRQTNAPF